MDDNNLIPSPPPFSLLLHKSQPQTQTPPLSLSLYSTSMEQHTETETHPTFQTKQRKAHLKSQMAGLRRTKRATSQRRSRRDHRRDSPVKQSSSEEDEKEQVEMKIQCLKGIVPGGESLGVDKLFDQTAAYIMALQCQLKAMKTLASFFEGLEKEKSEFGP